MVSGHKVFAGTIGSLLVLRGIAGFLIREQFMGLSAALDHNFLHVLVGTCYIWVSGWGKRSTARAWNKFLGWLYLFIGIIGVMDVGWMMQLVGQNSTADDLFNFFVALSSLIAGYYGTKIKKQLKGFMEANNWPFGQT